MKKILAFILTLAMTAAMLAVAASAAQSTVYKEADNKDVQTLFIPSKAVLQPIKKSMGTVPMFAAAPTIDAKLDEAYKSGLWFPLRPLDSWDNKEIKDIGIVYMYRDAENVYIYAEVLDSSIQQAGQLDSFCFKIFAVNSADRSKADAVEIAMEFNGADALATRYMVGCDSVATHKSSDANFGDYCVADADVLDGKYVYETCFKLKNFFAAGYDEFALKAWAYGNGSIDNAGTGNGVGGGATGYCRFEFAKEVTTPAPQTPATNADSKPAGDSTDTVDAVVVASIVAAISLAGVAVVTKKKH